MKKKFYFKFYIKQKFSTKLFLIKKKKENQKKN